MAEQVKRALAVKLRIVDILSAGFVKGEGWNPSSLLLGDQEVSRINMIAVVVSKDPPQQIVVDDGTATISVRSFDSSIASFEVGDVVQLIVKPREFSQQRYLVPEIAKKLSDHGWFALRKLELSKSVVFEVSPKEKDLPFERKNPLPDVKEIIRGLDKGEGVPYDEVLDKIGSPRSEAVLEQLLREGEIFEVKPGRLRLL